MAPKRAKKEQEPEKVVVEVLEAYFQAHLYNYKYKVRFEDGQVSVVESAVPKQLIGSFLEKDSKERQERRNSHQANVAQLLKTQPHRSNEKTEKSIRLLAAIREDREADLERELSLLPIINLNHVSDAKPTLFQEAVKHDKPNALKILRQHSLERDESWWKSCLLQCAKIPSGMSSACFQVLASCPFFVDSIVPFVEEALSYGARSTVLHALQWVYDDKNDPNHAGVTKLHLAVLTATNAKELPAINEASLTADALDTGLLPLHLAALNPNVEIVEALIKAGASNEHTTKINGLSASQIAAAAPDDIDPDSMDTTTAAQVDEEVEEDQVEASSSRRRSRGKPSAAAAAPPPAKSKPTLKKNTNPHAVLECLLEQNTGYFDHSKRTVMNAAAKAGRLHRFIYFLDQIETWTHYTRDWFTLAEQAVKSRSHELFDAIFEHNKNALVFRSQVKNNAREMESLISHAVHANDLDMFEYLTTVYGFWFDKDSLLRVQQQAAQQNKLLILQRLFSKPPVTINEASNSIESFGNLNATLLSSSLNALDVFTYLINLKETVVEMHDPVVTALLIAASQPPPPADVKNPSSSKPTHFDLLKLLFAHAKLHPNQLLEAEEEEEEDRDKDGDDDDGAGKAAKVAKTETGKKAAKKNDIVRGLRPLHVLFNAGQTRPSPEIVQWLLTTYPDTALDVVDRNGKTIFHYLSETAGERNTALELLEIALNHLDQTKSTVRVLEMVDKEGHTTLLKAAKHEWWTGLRRLMKVPGLSKIQTIPVTYNQGKLVAFSGWSLLHFAAVSYKGEKDGLNILTDIIEFGGDVNAVTADNQPVLHVAFPIKDNVSYLLKHPQVNVNIVDGNGHALIHLLLSRSTVDPVGKLVHWWNDSNHSLDLRKPDLSGRTPLHYAAEKGLVLTARWLLKQNVDLNAEDNDGNTPLAIAIKPGCVEFALWFLCVPGVRSSIQIHTITVVDEVKVHTSQSLYQFAISANYGAVIHSLLEDENVDRFAVLHDALLFRKYDVAVRLLKVVPQRDSSLWFSLFRPLDPATISAATILETNDTNGQLAMCQQLVAAGVAIPTGPLTTDPSSPLLLHLALTNKRPNVDEALLTWLLKTPELAAQATAPNGNKETPLHLVVQRQWPWAITKLLSLIDAKEKALSATDSRGETPFSLAVALLARKTSPITISVLSALNSATELPWLFKGELPHTPAYRWGLDVRHTPAMDALWIDLTKNIPDHDKNKIQTEMDQGRQERAKEEKIAVENRKKKMVIRAKALKELNARKQILKQLREKKAIEEDKIRKTQPERLDIPVDQTCQWQSYRVYVEGQDIYDALLNQTDLSYNVFGHNKYYVIQLLEWVDPEKNKKRKTAYFRYAITPKRYRVVNRWGRVGDYGESKLTDCETIDEAKALFTAKFREKTRNNWSDRHDFKKVNGKYDLIERHFDLLKEENEDDKDNKMDVVKNSKLSPSVAQLIKYITNIDVLRQQMLSLGLDEARLPLGKLSQNQIDQGYRLLREIEDAIRRVEDINKLRGRQRRELDGEVKTLEARMISLSNKYYTLIPTNVGMTLPQPINNRALLSQKISVLDSMESLHTALNFIAEQMLASTDGLTIEDAIYANLGTDIKELAQDSEIYKTILDYIDGSRHHLSPKVEAIYKISRWEELARFEQYAEMRQKVVGDRPHNMLLWHGSSVANILGILSHGLRIAPPDAPQTGHMFGKGVYFADAFVKSAGYCRGSHGQSMLMMLAEVAVGDCYKRHEAEYMDAPPVGYLSTQGLGRFSGGKDTIRTRKGVGVPIGLHQGEGTYLNYNEFIVYDVSQVKLKYLVRFRL